MPTAPADPFRSFRPAASAPLNNYMTPCPCNQRHMQQMALVPENGLEFIHGYANDGHRANCFKCRQRRINQRNERENDGHFSEKLKLKKRQKFAAASGAESSSSCPPASCLPFQKSTDHPIIIRIRVL